VSDRARRGAGAARARRDRARRRRFDPDVARLPDHHRQGRNLTVIIWDNGIYQTTGKQPTATAGSTDIAAVAKGAGISNSYWVRDEQHFEELTVRRFSEDGPLLLAAKIDDKPGPIQTPRKPALIRNRFMKGLGSSRDGALDA
jgi:thiamine pyrophosphate-dependent acetolactate synthase large subunit-like protein